MPKGYVAALAAVAVAFACTADDSPNTAEAPAPSVAGSPGDGSADDDCASLTASLPNDLRRTRATADSESAEANFADGTKKREVYLVAAADDEVFGHGLPGPSRTITINGHEARATRTETDTWVYQWAEPTAPGGCEHVSVTTIGLDAEERTKILETISFDRA